MSGLGRLGPMSAIIEGRSLTLLFLCLIPVVAPADDPPKVASEMIFDRAPFRSCHASTIVETESGQLLAALFAGTREGQADVGIWVSRRSDGGWTAPVEVTRSLRRPGADASLARHPTWNPVLFQPRAQPLMLFFKLGPSPSSWWG